VFFTSQVTCGCTVPHYILLYLSSQEKYVLLLIDIHHKNPRTLYTNLLCRTYYLASPFFDLRASFCSPFLSFFIFYSLQLLCHSLIHLSIIFYLSFLLISYKFPFSAYISSYLSIFPVVQ